MKMEIVYCVVIGTERCRYLQKLRAPAKSAKKKHTVDSEINFVKRCTDFSQERNFQ